MECERCDRLEHDLLRAREQLRQQAESHARERASYEAQIQALIDPLVRAKAMAPGPPIVLETQLLGCACAVCRRGA